MLPILEIEKPQNKRIVNVFNSNNIRLFNTPIKTKSRNNEVGHNNSYNLKTEGNKNKNEYPKIVVPHNINKSVINNERIILRDLKINN